MKQTRNTRTLLIALTAGVVVLAVAGIALLAYYVYLSAQSDQTATWQQPVAAFKSDQVAPDLAVLTLAGESDDRVIRAALDAGEVETAFASLAYSVLLPDSVRSGQWLLLANRLSSTEPARALNCERAALDLVALGPGLGDVARADIALQSAQGLHAIGNVDVERLALVEAENIARYSLTMLPAQRRSALQRAASLYQQLGDRQIASAILSQIESDSSGPAVKVESSGEILPELRGSVVLPQSVAEAIIARQSVAADLAARWLKTSDDNRVALAEALGATLQAEDSVRSSFYEQAGDLESADLLALLYDKIAWLTIKVRVARGGYGTSLVADWEGQVAELEIELSQAYTDLINGYGQQLDTLDPAFAVPARVELLSQSMLWIRLGLFPDEGGAAEEALKTQLDEASMQLWTRHGNAGLTIIVQDVSGTRLYLLSGSAGEASATG